MAMLLVFTKGAFKKQANTDTFELVITPKMHLWMFDMETAVRQRDSLMGKELLSSKGHSSPFYSAATSAGHFLSFP